MPYTFSSSQAALQDALDAFSQGEVAHAHDILLTAAQEKQTRDDLEQLFAVCCMRAAMAAMEGSTSVAEVMAEVRGDARQPAVTCYMEGLAAMARNNLQTARAKFEEARRRDVHFVLASLGLAAVHFHLGDYRASFAQYREVLSVLGSQLTPPVVRVGMGLCYYHLDRLDLARSCLERALEVHADDELALFGLLVVYLDRQQYAQVTDTVVRLRGLLPQNALVLLKVGDLLYFRAIRQRHVKAALRPLKVLLQKVRRFGTAEECAMADFQQGRLHLVAGDLPSAQRWLESALRTLPKLLAARIHYARVLLYTGKVQEGLHLLASINHEHPSQKEVLQLLAVHATRHGKHELALRYCRRLTENVAQGDLQSWALAAWCARLDPDECRSLLAHVLSIHHELQIVPPWQLLANLAVLDRDTDALQGLLDRELGGNVLQQPSLAMAYVPLVFNLALLLERSDRTRARQLYLFLVKRHSHFRLPYFRLHTMAREDGLVRQAAAWLTLLLQLIPEEPMAQACMARLYFQQKHYRTTIGLLRASPSLAKTTPVLLALGATYLWCCQQRGRDDRRFLHSAAERFLSVLRSDKGNILAAHGLACCRGLQRNYDSCQSLLNHVGEVTANVPQVLDHHHAHMANVKMLSESYKQAIDYLEKIRQPTPQQRSLLAFCLAREGREAEGIELLTRTLDESPGQTRLVYNLALLYCAAFLRRVVRSEALTLQEGRALRQTLARGMELAARYIRAGGQSSLTRTCRVFLKSVCAYCMHVYNGSLDRLLLIGQESEADRTREAARWANTFAAFQAELRQEELRQRQREETRREEQAVASKEILQSFRARRQSDPLRLTDPHLIAASQAELARELDRLTADAEQAATTCLDAAPSLDPNTTADSVLAGMRLDFGDAPEFPSVAADDADGVR